MDQIAPDQLAPQPQDQRPGVIKVFGIMHIILGVVGLLAGLFSLASQLAAKTMFEGIASTMGEEEAAAFISLSIEYTEKLASVAYLDFAARLLITVLLIMAGVALLKDRVKAVKKSNIYAFTSIGLKVIMLLVVVAVVIPATNEYYDAMAGSGGEQPAGMVQMQKMAGSAGQVITPIISMIYPALALILLNRKPVKDWLGQHGR